MLEFKGSKAPTTGYRTLRPLLRFAVLVPAIYGDFLDDVFAGFVVEWISPALPPNL